MRHLHRRCSSVCAQAERVVQAELASVATGTNEHIAALRRMSKIVRAQDETAIQAAVRCLAARAIAELTHSPRRLAIALLLASFSICCRASFPRRRRCCRMRS